MKNNKLLLVVAFGLLSASAVCSSLERTIENYDTLAYSQIQTIHRVPARVLGLTIAVISVTSPAPGSNFSAGTASIPVMVSTDQAANCRYAENNNDIFSAMRVFEQTGGITHSAMFGPLSSGQSYTLYVQCQDFGGNITPKAVTFFSVAPASSTAVIPVAGLSVPMNTLHSTSTASSSTISIAPIAASSTPPIIGLSVPTPVIAVLPFNVRDGWLIKFSKSPAVFLVKPEGLYAFDSMANLKKYQKISKQRIRYYAGSPDRYTIFPTSAASILNLQ